MDFFAKQFWRSRSGKAARIFSPRRSHKKSTQCKMYFDDCERNPFVEEWESWLPELRSRVSWTTSRTVAKKEAIDRLLGYTPESASKLSREQVEDETLQWAVDCNVIWADDEEGTTENSTISGITSRYSTISDLLVASDCKSTVEALAFLWSLVANLLENKELNSVHVVVFPNATSLWDYDTVVMLLQAIAIAKPLLPAQMQNVHFDLFHPSYKNSPRMWSPQMHSPFPTVGLSINDHISLNSDSSKNWDFEDQLDIYKSRLEALFASIDADDEFNNRLREENVDPRQILATCQSWAFKMGISNHLPPSCWVVDEHNQPFQLYASLWSIIQKMESSTNQLEPIMIAMPNVDAYTVKRLAITINAALQRLQSNVRVSNIFYPTAAPEDPRNAPCTLIQLSLSSDPKPW